MCARAALLVLLLALLTGCGTTRTATASRRSEAADLLRRLEVVALELGDFPLDGEASVVDGDTLRLRGLQTSLRLLAVDAEETFKDDVERAACDAGWEAWQGKLRGTSPRPVKMPTPLGEEAKAFARSFFEYVAEVRLERDHPGELRDYFGQYLAYVFVRRGGRWVNFNLEAVRAGMSPYFVKYGRSRRFHAAFLAAQQEAQTARRGIWKPGARHYDDYGERLAWWNEREGALARFEAEQANNRESHVVLTRWDALLRLEQRVGERAVVFGAVEDVVLGEGGPAVVRLSRTSGNALPVVFFDKDVLLSSAPRLRRGDCARLSGLVERRRDHRGNERLQLVVTLPGQLLNRSGELDELLRDRAFGPPTEEGE